MTTTELLQPFCAVGDIRYHLNNIFKNGDFLIACNGHVLVSVPDDGTVEIVPCDFPISMDVDKILKVDSWPSEGFIPLEFAEPDVTQGCATCNETGKVFQTDDCDECDGEGNFDYGSHNYECKECDGEGTLRAGSGDKVACGDCQGTGIKYQFLTIPDGRQFNFQYLLKLKALPGICYLPDHSGDEHGMVQMRFKFTNGLGLLMPVRK